MQNLSICYLDNNEKFEVEKYIELLTAMKASEIIQRVEKQEKIDDFHAKSRFFLGTIAGRSEKYSDKVGSLIDAYNKFK